MTCQKYFHAQPARSKYNFEKTYSKILLESDLALIVEKKRISVFLVRNDSEVSMYEKYRNFAEKAGNKK